MSLATLRRNLADAVSDATGLLVHPHVPNAMTPPCVVLRPDDPWVTSGDAYGTWQVHYLLTLYVKYSDFVVAIEAIEDALPPVLAALGDWGVDGVGTDYIAEIGDASIPAVDLNISCFTDSL